MTRTHDHSPLAGDEQAQTPDAAGHSWAHASGWMQLSGSRQTLSCVLPCQNQARILSKLLPVLSDSLTECGYPWELIVIDRGSRDQTAELLGAWTELPGFRSLRLQTQATQEDGFAAGLVAARGDAVVLFDPGVLHSPELIPRMVLLWEADAMLVHASPNPETGMSVLTPWDEALTRRRIEHADFMLPTGCTQLGLLDRQLVDWMLDAP
jgi:glycosyltransferase involved in cell wall biosynthesis